VIALLGGFQARVGASTIHLPTRKTQALLGVGAPIDRQAGHDGLRQGCDHCSKWACVGLVTSRPPTLALREEKVQTAAIYRACQAPS
jgi:hypothetical protein